MTGAVRPHLLFNSEWDSSQSWQAALASEFDDLGFSTPDRVESADAVNIALMRGY